MSPPAHEVIFQTKDEEMLAVNWDAFRTFEIYSPQDDPEARPRGPIPLPEINAVTLKKVVEYCEHHKDDIVPQENDLLSHGPDGQQKITEWDSQFIQVDEKMLFSIILAANYLDIKPLLYLGTATVGKLMRGKTPQEMQKLFTTVGDFTPEEEAEIKRQEGWEEWSPVGTTASSTVSVRTGHSNSTIPEPSLLD